jgi:hypothetical protein
MEMERTETVVAYLTSFYVMAGLLSAIIKKIHEDSI